MKSTTTISKIKTEFSLQNATSCGGIKIFLAFLEKIKLPEAMCSLSGGKARNSLFPVYRILLYLIVGWMLGCERIFHFRKLQYDALLRHFLGGRCPHHSLLYKELIRLGRFCPSLVNELRMLNQEIIRPCLPSELNLNAVLRPGNTHSSTDAADFLRQTFRLLDEHKVKYARFDKGFGGEDFYSLWEQNNIGYVGKLKWTKRLAKEVRACRYWTRYVDEEWIIEGIRLIYQATSWNKARRVAIIRKAQVFEDGQGRLVFDTDWQYEAMVTNLEWEPIDLWRFYNQRCCMENYIKEAKNGFSIDRIATGDFKANELDLLIKLLAYNLFERFKRDCCEPVHQGYTIARFRLEFFHCAATLIRHGRSVILKLGKDFSSRYVWKRIEVRVAQLE